MVDRSVLAEPRRLLDELPPRGRVLGLASLFVAALIAITTLMPEVRVGRTRIPVPSDEAVINGGQGPVTRVVSWAAAGSGDLVVFDSRANSPLGGVLWLLDGRDGNVLGQATVGASARVAVSPDRTRLFVLARSISADGGSVQMASALDLQTGVVLWETEVAWPGVTTALTDNAIAVAGDGSLVFVAAMTDHLGQGSASRISVLQAATGKRDRSIPGPAECDNRPPQLFNGADTDRATAFAVCAALPSVLAIEPKAPSPYRMMEVGLPRPRPRPFGMSVDRATGHLLQLTSLGEVVEIDLREPSLVAVHDVGFRNERFIETLSRVAPVATDDGRVLVVPIDPFEFCLSDGIRPEETTDMPQGCLIAVFDRAAGNTARLVLDHPVADLAAHPTSGFFVADGHQGRIVHYGLDAKARQEFRVGSTPRSITVL